MTTANKKFLLEEARKTRNQASIDLDTALCNWRHMARETAREIENTESDWSDDDAEDVVKNLNRQCRLLKAQGDEVRLALCQYDTATGWYNICLEQYKKDPQS